MRCLTENELNYCSYFGRVVTRSDFRPHNYREIEKNRDGTEIIHGAGWEAEFRRNDAWMNTRYYGREVYLRFLQIPIPAIQTAPRTRRIPNPGESSPPSALILIV